MTPIEVQLEKTNADRNLAELRNPMDGPFVLADFARELERENRALREAGGLMRAWIGNNERAITERWDSALANAKAEASV